MALEIGLDPIAIVTIVNLSLSVGCLYLLMALHTRRKKRKMKMMASVG